MVIHVLVSLDLCQGVSNMERLRHSGPAILTKFESNFNMANPNFKPLLLQKVSRRHVVLTRETFTQLK